MRDLGEVDIASIHPDNETARGLPQPFVSLDICDLLSHVNLHRFLVDRGPKLLEKFNDLIVPFLYGR